ncbi:MAG: HEAT repeat domain-containing protein [Planctomycetota bacterium]
MNRRISWVLPGSLGVLVACAGGSEVRIAPAEVGDSTAPLTPDQAKVLAAAEKLYRAEDAEFVARRDELARDPVLARWLTRLFARDAVVAFDRRQASDADFLRQAAGQDPLWDRALDQLRAMGGAAAPCLIEDFLRHPRHDRRRLGVTLLGVAGEGALPAMKDVLASPDPAMRRLAVMAVGEMSATPATTAELLRAAGDREFTLRAAAYEGLANAGPPAAPHLRRALTDEADGYVRRVIARALAGDPSKVTATALVQYMRRCLDEGDRAGFDVAHEALSRLAGTNPRRPRGHEAWARWAAEQPERWEIGHGAVEDRSR